MPHELTHKILYDIYGSEGYKNIPTWLVEGLATYFEPTPDPAFALALKEANSNGTLLRFESLCHSFPEDQHLTLLSYAESASITNYIQKNYGWSSIRILLQRYAEDGIECEAGIEDVLGLPGIEIRTRMEGLDRNAIPNWSELCEPKCIHIHTLSRIESCHIHLHQ